MTRPGHRPDNPDNVVDDNPVYDDAPAVTGADIVRTRPEPVPDNPSDGVRVEYRATVPRGLIGAAFVEALAAIDQARGDPYGPAATGVEPCTASWAGSAAGPACCWRAASHNAAETAEHGFVLHTGITLDGVRHRWSDSDDDARPHRPGHPPDTSGPGAPTPITTSTDTGTPEDPST
ncbi:hypothetical protein [Streptomyces kronopolitis]|uniref:hypothetical protein n=1 Tax=Streptomyces kronopolitis TaxID=1612435 RepID=UPI003D99DCDB